jgi:hypothetical protein
LQKRTCLIELAIKTFTTTDKVLTAKKDRISACVWHSYKSPKSLSRVKHYNEIALTGIKGKVTGRFLWDKAGMLNKPGVAKTLNIAQTKSPALFTERGFKRR